MKYSTAKVSITPDWPVFLAGYSARSARSAGVKDDISVRGLLIDDGKTKFIILTLELCFVRRIFADSIKRELLQKYGLAAEQILITSSHTHSGPDTLASEGLLYRETGEPEHLYAEFLREGKRDICLIYVQSIQSIQNGTIVHNSVNTIS